MQTYSRDIYKKLQLNNKVKVCAPCHYLNCIPVEEPNNRKSCKTIFTNEKGEHLGICACLGNHDVGGFEAVMQQNKTVLKR